MRKLIFSFLFFLIPFFVYADSGRSTIVMDVDSGRILYSKNSHEKRLIASITKIMTCIVVLENSNIEDEIVIGEEVLSMYGTNIYIEVGEKMKIKDLLYGLMLRSGNDAAITLAVNTLGEEKFVAKMNELATKIGMRDTLFQNPHGLDDKTKNVSTAYDMALLSLYAYKNRIYREIISTKKYLAVSSLKSYSWYNRMNLLTQYKNCLGGKNGYTPKAGKTLVSYAGIDDTVFTIVSLNDSDIYQNHKNLYKTFFSRYKTYVIIDKNKFYIDNSLINKKVYLKKSFSYVLSSDEVDKVTTLVYLYPFSKKSTLGEIQIRLKKEIIGKIYIYEKNKKK